MVVCIAYIPWLAHSFTVRIKINSSLTIRFFTSAFSCFLVQRPIFITRPSSQSVDLTQTATFTCSATGYNVSYQWTIGSGSFPNDRVTGRNTNTLTVTDVRSSDDNTYICVVSNRGGTRHNGGRLTVTGMTMMIV